MTGRDLIIYILENGLENEPIFKDGKIIGFITAGEAAAKMNVGVATICLWVCQKRLSGIMVGNMLYIPANAKPPVDI
jgi:predicted transcriptional regulator